MGTLPSAIVDSLQRADRLCEGTWRLPAGRPPSITATSSFLLDVDLPLDLRVVVAGFVELEGLGC